MIPSPSASRRSRRIALRLREDERGQEIVEAGIALVEPVELLVVALQQPVLAERVPIGLGQEGEWIDEAPIFSRSARKPATSAARAVSRSACGETRSRGPVTGVNGTRDLQLRIVAPAGALVGVGPAVVEDVLALAMGLRVAGRGGDDLAGVPVLDQDMHRLPARAPADAARILERRQEGVRDEGVVGLGRLRPVAGRRARRTRARRVRHGVPLRGRDSLEALRDADLDFEGRAAHAAIVSYRAARIAHS